MPLIVRARLHTAKSYDEIKAEVKGQHFTVKEMKAMARSGNYFDGLEVFLSKWNWDHHESWHLYTWQKQDDETVKKAIYEAEQYHPFASARYKNNFEKFEKDWKNGEYDPGMTFTFKDSECEVLEVVQEEVDNIDPEEVKKAVRKAEDIKHEKRRRMKASRGSRYRKRYY